MGWRVKTESFMVACNSFLKIVHLSELLKSGAKSIGEVMEGRRVG
jgi:hypothetical protein